MVKRADAVREGGARPQRRGNDLKAGLVREIFYLDASSAMHLADRLELQSAQNLNFFVGPPTHHFQLERGTGGARLRRY